MSSLVAAAERQPDWVSFFVIVGAVLVLLAIWLAGR